MFDLFEEILGMFCLIFLIIIFLAGLCFLGYTTINGTLYLLDKSECVAIVAGNVVYNGRCHFISVHSIGENGNSKVLTIYNDIFGFKPKARYINQDIEVTND